MDRFSSRYFQTSPPPAAVLIKFICPAANPSLLRRWKAFLFSDLTIKFRRLSVNIFQQHL